ALVVHRDSANCNRKILPSPDISFSLRALPPKLQNPPIWYAPSVRCQHHHHQQRATEKKQGTATVMRKPDSEEEDAGKQSPTATEDGEGDGPVDCGLEDALAVVVSSLDDYRGQFLSYNYCEQS
ncbi:unnamed protein product, partial [Pleuronectes platessa]